MVRLFDRDDPAGRRTCNPGRFQDPLGRLRPVIGRVHCLRLVRVCRYQGLGQLQSSSVRLLVDLFAHNFWDMQEYTLVTLYHRTTEDIARLIVVDGFRDGEGYYGTEYLHSGVWLSDRPLEADEGALGNALLRVELNVGDQQISQFEWIEDGKPYREWLIPARLINEIANRVAVEVEN
jgi:hypothetical protein